MSQQLQDHLLVKRLLLFLCSLIVTSILYVEYKNRKPNETVDVATNNIQQQTTLDAFLDLWNISSTTDENIFDTCPLQKTDPWNTETVRALGVRETKHCVPDAIPPTILTGKRIVRNPKHPRFGKDMRCQARCALYVAENQPIFYDKWRDIDEKYEHECDIIQVECTYGSKWYASQKDPYVHIQIREYERDRFQSAPGFGQKPSGAPTIGNDSFHPNVYVIVVDSVSVNAAYRQFGKTIAFLEKLMQAVRFEHLAKVAENSKPNAYALFFGEIPVTVDRSTFGVMEPLVYTLSEAEHCHQALDGKNFLLFEYEDAGYKTMWSCDYLEPTFAMSGCSGLVAQPATHYMRPFQELLKHGPIINVMIDQSVCRAAHHYILDYTDKFFRAYPGKPKMSTTWITDVAHDSEKHLSDADVKFLDIFVKNKRELDESIVIVMGDHGPRFDAYQPSIMFTDTNYRPINNSYGSSLLRKFDPKTPRNCKNLPIPAQYCLCKYGQKPEYDQSKLKTLGHLTIDHINDLIKESGMADMCALQELLHVDACYKVDAADGGSAYSIRLRTKLGAEFRMKFLEHTNGDTEVISGSEERLNKYGDQAACVPAEHLELRPFCFCNKK